MAAPPFISSVTPADRAILWDVGGTLVDFACTLPDSVRRRLSACGLDHSRVSDQHIEQTYRDFHAGERQWATIELERAAETEWLKALLKDELLSDEIIHQAAKKFPRYFELYRPVSGIVELLAELRQLRLPMAIVSNWPPSLPEFLEFFHFPQYFDAIVYSGQDGVHKPDPRIFQRGLDLLQAPAASAIFIGDDFNLDIIPARSMGMRAIHFEPRRRAASRDADDVQALRALLMPMLGFSAVAVPRDEAPRT